MNNTKFVRRGGGWLNATLHAAHQYVGVVLSATCPSKLIQLFISKIQFTKCSRPAHLWQSIQRGIFSVFRTQCTYDCTPARLLSSSTLPPSPPPNTWGGFPYLRGVGGGNSDQSQAFVSSKGALERKKHSVVYTLNIMRVTLRHLMPSLALLALPLVVAAVAWDPWALLVAVAALLVICLVKYVLRFVDMRM